MDVWAIIAGGLALLSVTLSFFEIIKHLTNFTKPYLQRYIIRILLMVPIYSLNAWIAMVVPATGLYLDSLREVYESFVIYSFMKYLLNFLQYETDLRQYIHLKPGPKQIFPFCLLPQCVGGKRFLTRCKHGILQYVVVRPFTSLIAFISQLFNFYGEGNYNPISGYAYPVLLLINNASQILAMYCLVIFYTGYRQELRPMKPLAKFFSIKLVVFFSFFQYVVILALLEINCIEDAFKTIFPEMNDKVAIARKSQELLICLDMLIAAIGHLFAFSYKEFVESDEDNVPFNDVSNDLSSGSEKFSRSCCQALCNIFDFTDEKSDMREHFSHIFDKLRQVLFLGPREGTISHSEEHLEDSWTDIRATNSVTADSFGVHQQRPTDTKTQAPINSSAKNYQSIR